MPRYRFYDPLTGRSISERTFLDRTVKYEIAATDAADQMDYALARMDAARTARSESYWQRKFDAARAEYDAFTAAVEDMSYQAEATYPEVEEELPESAMLDDRARQALGLANFSEWEFGSDYKASRKGGHDVSVNVRLRFDEKVSEQEAREAMNQIVEGGAPPLGVEVHAVNWRRKEGQHWKRGDERDLENFLPVLYVGGVQYLRAGAVKPNKL